MDEKRTEADVAKILVVDDDPLLLRAVARVLEKAGHEVVTAGTGEEALEVAHEERPELVLLDVVLPDVSGLEVCQELKAHPDLRDTYVILLSSLRTSTDDHVLGIDLGADGYIARPIPNRELVARVWALVRLQKAQAKTRAHARRQAVVAELGQRALRSKDFDALLQEAVESVAETLEVPHCGILELLPDGGGLRLRAGVGWHGEEPVLPEVDEEVHAQTRRALRTGAPIIVEDYRTERRFEPLGFHENFGLVSGVSVVIQGRGGPFGFLGAHTTEKRTFTEDDVNFLTSVANVLAATAERRRAAGALRESEMRYRRIVETSREGVGIVDAEGQVIFVNGEMAEMLGYARAEVIGRSVLDFVDEEWQSQIPEFRERRRRGVREQHDMGFRRRDGRLVWAIVNATPIFDEEGEYVGALGMVTNITERKQMEEALRWQMEANGSVADLGRALLSTASLEEVAELVLKHAQRLTSSVAGYVGHIDPRTGNLVCPTMSREVWQCCHVPDKNAIFEKTGGLWGRVMRAREPVLTNDVASHPHSEGTPEGHIVVQRFLSVPALAGDDLVGQVALANADRDYTERDLELVQRLADLYAVAVQRHHREQTLRRSERKFRRFVELSVDAIVIADVEGKVVEWNRGAEEIFGLPAEAVLERPIWDVQFELATEERATPEARERLRLSLQKLLEGETSDWIGRPVEMEIRRPDGTKRVVESIVFPVQSGSGAMIGSITRDETQQKETEAELRRLKESLEARVAERTFELKMLYDLSREVGYTLDYGDLAYLLLRHLHRVVPYDVSASLLVTNNRHDELVIKTTARLAPGLQEDLCRQLMRTYEHISGVSLDPDRISPECRVLEAGNYDGEREPLAEMRSIFQVPLLAGRDQDLVGLILVAAEEEGAFSEDHVRLLYTVANQASVSVERLRAVLDAEQRQQETLIENLPEGVVLLDEARHVALTNPRARTLLELIPVEREEGGRVARLGPWSLDEVLERGGEATPLTLTVGAESTHERVIEITARPLSDAGSGQAGIILVLRDVTEARRLEERIHRQERLASVGQLAGGIAHDFNNMLTIIILYAQQVLNQPYLAPEMEKNLHIILDQSNRATELVQQILDFSRRSMMEAGPLDLGPFVKEAMKLLRRTLPENIDLELEMEDERYPINGDPTRIQQAILNLVLNARDAMPEGGRLCIRLRRLADLPLSDIPEEERSAGPWVALTVSDVGTGIEPEIMDRLFEPFFTTKPTGKGTGLGLPQVYGIVKQHDAYIDVESTPGVGSSFHLYFPASDGAGPEEVSVVPEDSNPEGRGETILLVEDEARIRTAARAILESLGYRVLEAGDGAEALEVFRAADEVDLVITDLVMPKMGGEELVKHVREQRPELKAVAITGYAVPHRREELAGAGIVALLQKPFDVAALAEVVHQALDGDLS